LWKRPRPGAMVLVGGKHGWFEGARRTIAGWFKWVEVVNEGSVFYRSEDFKQAGTVVDDEATLREADKLAADLAKTLRKYRG